MKHFLRLVCLLMLLTAADLHAQGIAGDWSGILETPAGALKLIVHVEPDSAGGYRSTLQVPKQSPKKLPADVTRFADNVLTMEFESFHIHYTALLRGDSLVNGVFTQGAPFAVNMIRGKGAKAVPRRRPQEPQPPFPYKSEDVTFRNEQAGISLAGTLTMPDKRGKFSCVILISGSGPENRNEEIFGHKPFLVLADYLTRQGIAVLRVDDRGVGQSGGTFSGATTMDFAQDVRAAIAYLRSRKDINRKKIGLMGHSEGGIIGSIVAAGNKDVDFLVLLAGTGLRGDRVLLQQQADIGRAQGLDSAAIAEIRRRNEGAFRIVMPPGDSATVQNALLEYLRNIEGEDPDNERSQRVDAVLVQQAAQLNNRWVRYFLAYDPAEALRRVDCPVLALGGSRDLQVHAEQNLSAIRNALREGGNRQVRTEVLPGLNHLFQEATTGNPAEYGTIEQTFSPAALEIIGSWLREQLR